MSNFKLSERERERERETHTVRVCMHAGVCVCVCEEEYLSWCVFVLFFSDWPLCKWRKDGRAT